MTEMSEFGRILRQVVEETPGIHGAVFTDWEGEPVDQYARGPVIDVQIAGAQWALVLTQAAQALVRARAGQPRSIHVACTGGQVFVRAITHEYFVIVQASADAHLGKTLARLERAADELASKM
jgi:predicted regulator of Ras-like GTPase activity (Roadblock/LC7/MglB family)